MKEEVWRCSHSQWCQ